MKKMTSIIKSFCKLAVIAAAVFCGLGLTATKARAAEKTYYIVYHDDYRNIIRRDKASADYTFKNEDPFFFVTLPVSNTGWCTEYLTVAQKDAGADYSPNVIKFRENDKLTDKVTFPLTEDLHLYPITQYGIYVRFDSQGGTPQPYQFLHVGEKAVRPESTKPMSLIGYTFDGWYNTPECNNGDEFDFNWSPTREELTAPNAPKEKYAYAKWIPAQSSYKIVVWLEKAEHEKRTNLADAMANISNDYDYGTFIEKTGTTGQNVEFTTSDMNSNAIKTVTYFERRTDTFEVFKYDDGYSSFAQSLSGASISEINNGGGIAADGTTVVNVFYRRLVFNVVVGVLNETYVPTGKDYWQQLPESRSWDTNYDHFTVSIKDGESIGHAIQFNNITLSDNTESKLKSQLNVYNTPHINYLEFDYTNPTLKVGYSSDHVVWDITIDSGTAYQAPTFYKLGARAVSDGMTIYCVLAKAPSAPYQYVRITCFQTIESAIAGNETSYPNANLDYYVQDRYESYSAGTTNGFQNFDVEGFDFWYSQCYDRKNKKQYSGSPYGEGTYGGTYCNYTDSKPYALESYYRRKSFSVDYETGTTRVKADKGFSIYYEENLTRAIPKTGGQDFTSDVTFYTDSEGKKFYFKGWYENEAFTGDPVNFETFSMPAKNVILYAKWEEKKITVTFDANDGTIQGESTYDMVISAGSVPANPGNAESSDMTGHTGFFCWTKDGVMYDFVEPLYEDVTLEALYYVDPAQPFKITYNAGKGTGNDVVEFDDYGYLYNANAGYQPYEYEAYFGDWALPQGKIFKHWEGSDGQIYDSNLDPNKEIIMKHDVTLTAVYEGGHADIVINREGLLKDETAIFDVYRMVDNVKTFVMRVSLTGTDSEGATVSRKLLNMEPGTYVVEETAWSWAYEKGITTVKEWQKTATQSPTNGTGTGTVAFNETLEFTFTGNPLTNVTKHGEDAQINKFAPKTTE